jgi:hypothetical protein
MLAAQNIKRFGLNQQNLIGQDLPESKPVETVGCKTTSMKQESPVL